MSMDPSKWINFDKLSDRARERIEAIYPYLKIEQCVFQEKDSGVFMKQGNGVKIEKLLDPPRDAGREPARATPPPPVARVAAAAPAAPATPAASTPTVSSGRTRK